MNEAVGFKNGIIDFMRSNNVQLNYDGKFDEASVPMKDSSGKIVGTKSFGPITWCKKGGTEVSLEFPSDVWVNMTTSGLGIAQAGSSGGVARTITLYRSKGFVDTGVRYLPWQPDRVTYMRMRGGANLFFTGPLSGCNVYVAGPKTGPVIFHTNNNSNGDDDVANGAAKKKMALDLLAMNVIGLSNNTVISGKLERGVYSGNYIGFVFGFKKGSEWEFYFNGVGAGIKMLKRIF